ncbi:MAG: mechanosensitive ion channel domain-containing protein [Gemmatimonadota bacterium]
MSQTPLPIPDSLTIDVPLPGALEQWRDIYLHSAIEKLVVFVLFVVFFYILARLAKRAIGRHIEDVNRSHVLRKWVTYAFVVLLLLVAVALFADWLTGLGTVLALMVAGIAVALQDVLKSIVGWIYMSSRSGVEIGSRIEVNGIVGDVIDIGVLKTTMLEVGGALVYGRQSTGRLVTVPNYRMLSDAVLIAPGSSPYVWQEVLTRLTFESDWRRAEEIMREIGDEIHIEVAPGLERSFRHLERRYAFKHGALTPIVYVTIGTSGVELALRFLVQVRRRRGAVDHASRRLLAALAREPNIRIAYTTYRVYRPDQPFSEGQPARVKDEGGVGLGPEEGMVTE